MNDLHGFEDFLKQEFGKLLASIEARGLRISAQQGFSANDAFALRAYLSLALRPGEELIVVSVDCKIRETSLEIDCDIALADGELISEGPVTQLGQLNSAEFVAASAVWAKDFATFLDAEREGLLTRLKRSR